MIETSAAIIVLAFILFLFVFVIYLCTKIYFET